MGNILDTLFSSKTRVKLLVFLLSNPDAEFFVRELTRALHEQINSIRRELFKLESIGLLVSRNEKRKRYYTVNKDFILYEELYTMVKKINTAHGDVAVEIAKLGHVDLLLLTGIFTQSTDSPIDILAIGTIDKDRLSTYIQRLERQLTHELKYAVLTKEDYLFRKNCHDQFIKKILESEYKVAVNRLTSQLQL